MISASEAPQAAKMRAATSPVLSFPILQKKSVGLPVSTVPETVCIPPQPKPMSHLAIAFNSPFAPIRHNDSDPAMRPSADIKKQEHRHLPTKAREGAACIRCWNVEKHWPRALPGIPSSPPLCALFPAQMFPGCTHTGPADRLC